MITVHHYTAAESICTTTGEITTPADLANLLRECRPSASDHADSIRRSLTSPAAAEDRHDLSHRWEVAFGFPIVIDEEAQP